MQINAVQRGPPIFGVVKRHIVKINPVAAGFGKRFMSVLHGLHIHNFLYIIKAAAQFHRLHGNRHHIQERRKETHSQQDKQKIGRRRQRIS